MKKVSETLLNKLDAKLKELHPEDRFMIPGIYVASLASVFMAVVLVTGFSTKKMHSVWSSIHPTTVVHADSTPMQVVEAPTEQDALVASPAPVVTMAAVDTPNTIAKATTVPKQQSCETREYIVAPNDGTMLVSLIEYHTVRHYDLIETTNHIKGHLIIPGQKLKIPCVGEDARAGRVTTAKSIARIASTRVLAKTIALTGMPATVAASVEPTAPTAPAAKRVIGPRLIDYSDLPPVSDLVGEGFIRGRRR